MTSRNLLTEWVATLSNRGGCELFHHGQQQLAIAFILIDRPLFFVERGGR
jgi:hypothetical protein